MFRLFLASLLVTAAFDATSRAEHPVRFNVRLLTVDANEGCDVADIDGDGKIDVVAGRNWYHNPDWTPRPVRLLEDWNGYVRSNGEKVLDVNGDGRPDVVSMDFTSPTLYWYENPGGEKLMRGYLWPQHVLVDTGQKTNETCLWTDVDGDGQPEMIANQWKPKTPMILWKLGTTTKAATVRKGRKQRQVRLTVPTMDRSVIGHDNAHGIGSGDINNDGRADVVFGHGWYERPAGKPLAGIWKLHADWNLHASCPMLVYDVDGDGINDLVWSKAHDYGIYWWQGQGPDSSGKLQFKEHLIDKSFSQAHCLVLADLDGDGKQELITGKRVRAHNGGDPGSSEPPIMRYYAWNPVKKAFDGYTMGPVGAGLQIRPADLDDDGDIDIVVAGKDGTQILLNQRIP